MPGRSCLYRQQNIEKRKVMSVREWSELCAKDDLRAPGVDDVELKAAADSVGERRRRRKRSWAKDTVQVVKEEYEHEELVSLEASPDIDAEEVE